jgi:Flp pilus assembly protein TadG
MQKIVKKLKLADKGQSLVELAIIAPILLFMLIGVFEVGWALRGYLVLVNVNREITRFAIRPGYLDFTTQDTVITSYQRIREWVDTSLAGQLDLDFDDNTGNATLIVSHIVIDMGLPCDQSIVNDPAQCVCSQFETNPSSYANNFTLDDLVVHPGKLGQEYQAMRFGPEVTETGTRTVRINYRDLVSNTLVPQNNRRNCELIQKGSIPSANNMIVTELFFDQPQLFGFPLISNPFTDPVPLYTRTTMRLVSASRSSGTQGGGLTANIDTVGPVCDVYPFAVRATSVATAVVGVTTVDIFDGQGGAGNHHGWLAWNPGQTSEANLADELNYPTAALNNYINPTNASDRILNHNDWVASLPGEMDTTNINDLIQPLVGRKIRVAVWNSFNTNRYQINDFVWVTIQGGSSIDLSPGRRVNAIFEGDASAGCPP